MEAEVKATPELRAVLIQDVLTDLERMAERHADLREFAKVWAEVRKVREKREESAAKRRRKSEDEARVSV